MSARLISFFTLLLLVFSSKGEMQLSFEYFPYMDQLPSSSVRRVLQDSEGYMWFGTLDGVCRYDGYQVRTFRSDMHNPSLLTNNDIQSLAEDKQNRIWIGTKQGINLLDRNTLTITPFEESLVQGDNINALTCDDKGNMWIATSRGLFCYDVSRKLLKTYWSDPYDEKTLPDANITYISRDNKGNIWIMFWNEGLCRYLPETDNFERFPATEEMSSPFRLYQDKDEQYWLCTWGNGFFKFDPDALPDERYTRIPVYNAAGGEEQTFFSMVQDDHYGYYWLMSLTGLYVFDFDKENTLFHPVDISKHLSGSSKLYSEIIKDKDNNLWIGAYSEGAIFVNFRRSLVRNYGLEVLNQKLGFPISVRALSEDSEGLVWLGINRYGLFFYDRKENQVFGVDDMPAIQSRQELNNLKTVNYIREIKSRKEHWVCCDDQWIYIFRKNQRGIVYAGRLDLNVSEELNWASEKVLCEDKDGNVWVGMLNQGLVKISPDNQVSMVEAIPMVTGITQDLHGDIWVSSEKVGLNCLKFSGDSYRLLRYDKYSEGLNTSNIQSVCTDVSGKLWLGTKEGRLLTFDKNTARFEDMSLTCAMTGESILNLLIGKDNNLWISTNKKISSFNPRTLITSSYSLSDNLVVKSFIKGSYSATNTEEVLFGGNKGFCAFTQSRQHYDSLKNVQVHITDIKVHNQSIFNNNRTQDYDPLQRRLVLGPSERNVEFEFSSLNYAAPLKVQYAYKLQGLDQDWTKVNTSRRFASYNNLQKGKYELLLMATDENGRWAEPVLSLEIIKKPPLYLSWWASLLYVVLLLLLLFALYRFFANRVRLNQQLNIAQIEKAKSEELSQTKLRYFTNFSHELLTPLTVISCLVEDVDQVSGGEYWQHEVMKVNLSRLKRLLQQILDFRKVESGSMKLRVAESNMIEFVERICAFNFIPLAKERNISFEMQFPDYSVQGWYDPEKLDIMLFNLLSNAFKFTSEEGSVRLGLSILKKSKGRIVQLIVSDTGRGIDPADLEQIFTRFYSNDPSLTIENHGIGLTLTKELVEMHHGSIRVESEPGKGTTFILEFPVDKFAYAPEEMAAEKSNEEMALPDTDCAANKSETTAVPKEDIHILIVEDNAQLCNTINSILGRNYHTYTASDGKEAVAVINSRHIDLVVSDIIMPEMDGLELCRTIKNNLDTSHIEVLLLTAKNSINDRIESYNAGADGYLSKPFELKVLQAKINSLVRNRKRKTEYFKHNADINISSLEYTSLDEKFLENAVAIIEEHIAVTDFNLDLLSSRLNMSKSSLYRKIKSLTGLSPVEFTKNIRLKHACQMLASQAGNISDIAYAVGFADPKYFTSCFKAEFGLTPTEYIKKSRKEA
jgi:signal transduction histidine kinase/ligand-binding sensor domain-containing protein/DNA-binding response OmpR family regulator